MREEFPVIPAAIADIVGQYAASRGWLEVGAKLTLSQPTP
jgi:hypothetical protein